MAILNYAGTRAARACLFVLLFPLAAAAQSSTPQAAPGQGPMLVERVKSGFLVAPEDKIAGDARLNLEIIRRMGLDVRSHASPEAMAMLAE